MFSVDSKKYSTAKRVMKNAFPAFSMMLVQSAYAGVNIGSGGGGLFATITQWLQDFVDFLSGPFGVAAVVVGAVLAFATWIVLPKEGIVAGLVRIVVGGLALINLGTWIYAMSQS